MCDYAVQRSFAGVWGVRAFAIHIDANTNTIQWYVLRISIFRDGSMRSLLKTRANRYVRMYVEECSWANLTIWLFILSLFLSHSFCAWWFFSFSAILDNVRHREPWPKCKCFNLIRMVCGSILIQVGKLTCQELIKFVRLRLRLLCRSFHSHRKIRTSFPSLEKLVAKTFIFFFRRQIFNVGLSVVDFCAQWKYTCANFSNGLSFQMASALLQVFFTLSHLSVSLTVQRGYWIPYNVHAY